MVVWWKKVNPTGALSSMIVGLLTWLIAREVAPELPGDLLGKRFRFDGHQRHGALSSPDPPDPDPASGGGAHRSSTTLQTNSPAGPPARGVAGLGRPAPPTVRAGLVRELTTPP